MSALTAIHETEGLDRYLDEIVVDERRHVHELDRDACGKRGLHARRR